MSPRDRQRQREGGHWRTPTISCSAIRRHRKARAGWSDLHRAGGLYGAGEVPEGQLLRHRSGQSQVCRRKADNGWIAMIQHYFVAAWIPRKICRASSTCASWTAPPNPAVTAGVIVPVPVAAPGAKVDFSFLSMPDRRSSRPRPSGTAAGRGWNWCARPAAGRRLRLADGHRRTDLLVSAGDLQSWSATGAGRSFC
jgi:hypothetical protein